MNIIILFLYGLIFGSAGNALIDRLVSGKSWAKGRSKCDSCGHDLEWKDLIPLLSYLSLKGRCRYCNKKIPTRNFWLELGMGAGFILIYNIFPFLPAINLIILLGIYWTTLVIAVMDWETMLVNEGLIAVWGGLGIINSLFSLNIRSGLIGLAVGMGVIGLLWAGSRGKAMGFGDVEIAAVMGWWLGWPKVAVGIWMAFITGAIYGTVLLLTKKKGMKSQIPFGPFLITGAWIAFIIGERLWKIF